MSPESSSDDVTPFIPVFKLLIIRSERFKVVDFPNKQSADIAYTKINGSSSYITAEKLYND